MNSSEFAFEKVQIATEAIGSTSDFISLSISTTTSYENKKGVLG